MMAWLHARPKPDEGSLREQVQKNQPRLSRLERMKKQGVSPAMPPNPLPHTLGRLIEMGLTEPAGMGSAPLSWLTIDAWQRTTGVTLEPWEARLIRSLSSAYLVEGQRAEAETCPPPWSGSATASERDTERMRLESVLG